MDGTANTGPSDATGTSLPTRDPWETIGALQQAMTSLADQVASIVAAGAPDRGKQVDLAAKVGGLAQSPEIDQLAAALAAAQAELHNPALNREAKVELKSGGSYEHKFADLPGILATVRPVLGKHGISFMQVPSQINGSNYLVTRLMHGSGQWIQSALPLSPIGERIQAWGGQITFLKRYALSAILGVAGENDDDDANAWVGNTAEVSDRRGGVPPSPPARLPRGEAARQRKAADDAADAAAAAAVKGPPADQPGDPGPGPEPSNGSQPSRAPADSETQRILRELPMRLKDCFDPRTGEIDIPAAEAAWNEAAPHLKAAKALTVEALVDRYRKVLRRDPPTIEGVSYPEPAGAGNA